MHMDTKDIELMDTKVLHLVHYAVEYMKKSCDEFNYLINSDIHRGKTKQPNYLSLNIVSLGTTNNKI
jgi:hypothetical protein